MVKVTYVPGRGWHDRMQRLLHDLRVPINQQRMLPDMQDDLLLPAAGAAVGADDGAWKQSHLTQLLLLHPQTTCNRQHLKYAVAAAAVAAAADVGQGERMREIGEMGEEAPQYDSS